MRGLALAAAIAVIAPFQCAHSPDPDVRREDTAGDALWSLAQDFHAKHDAAGERATLTFLVEHYPSSRYAPAARDALGDADAGTGAGAPPVSAP